MNSLDYKFSCLDGYYHILILLDDNKYQVDTNINGLNNIESSFDNSLINKLEDLKLERWQKDNSSYLSVIEDHSSFEIKYIKDDQIYEIYGEESYEPYDYDKLIDFLILIDSQANYLKFE